MEDNVAWSVSTQFLEAVSLAEIAQISRALSAGLLYAISRVRLCGPLYAISKCKTTTGLLCTFLERKTNFSPYLCSFSRQCPGASHPDLTCAMHLFESLVLSPGYLHPETKENVSWYTRGFLDLMSPRHEWLQKQVHGWDMARRWTRWIRSAC